MTMTTNQRRLSSIHAKPTYSTSHEIGTTDTWESMRYYNRQGKEIAQWQWAELIADETYRLCMLSHLPRGQYIYTCWMGLDLEVWPSGVRAPLIFDTTSGCRYGGITDVIRASNETDALAWHHQLLQELRQHGT